MAIVLHKYSGAGNDFIVIDGRDADVSAFRRPERISALCEEYFTDGLMILSRSERYDFRMEFFNPDGSGGMMCGNGGRCIAAFAQAVGVQSGSGADWISRIGLRPETYLFEAPDGLHTADIVRREGERATVRLKMKDVHEVVRWDSLPDVPGVEGWFLDTGTRHFVRFVPDAAKSDLAREGKAVRWSSAFAPQGVNANFVSVEGPGELRVRTFEKGVEGETLACGTGLTASAIAACFKGEPPYRHAGRRMRYLLHARRDDLMVDFVYMQIVDYRRHEATYSAVDVYLIGPAEEVPLQ